MDASSNERIKFGVKHGRDIIIVFVVVAVILFAVGIGVSSTTATYILIILGVISVALCISSANDIKRFKKYANIIFLQNVASTSQLGAILNKSTSTVESELHNLISLGYFPLSKIEEGKLLFNNETAPDTSQQADTPQAMRKCPGCGAPSKENTCEYCGSLTSG